MQINFVVTDIEAAQILNALAERPFKEVNNLIGKLHTATTAQITEYEKAKRDGDISK